MQSGVSPLRVLDVHSLTPFDISHRKKQDLNHLDRTKTTPDLAPRQESGMRIRSGQFTSFPYSALYREHVLQRFTSYPVDTLHGDQSSQRGSDSKVDSGTAYTFP